MATLLEPFQAHNLRNSAIEGAFESEGTFSSRSIQIAKMYIKAKGGEKLFVKPPEGYLILSASDSVFFLYMKVNPDVQGYEISTYDDMTDNVKILGHVPHSYDSQKLHHNILGSLTEDRNFAVVLKQSTEYKSVTVCVFDVANAICLLTRECSEIGFVGCDLFGVAINPIALSQGQYRIAVLNKHENTDISRMGVRIWDPVTLGERYLQLKCFWGIPGQDKGIVKFSLAARFLCVLGEGYGHSYLTCLLLDPVLLEPLFMAEYGLNHWYEPKCNVFPTFSTSGSKFALYNYTIEDRFNPRLLFFEIPSTEIQTLKELCRNFIVNLVIDDFKLIELPLPKPLIAYLKCL